MDFIQHVINCTPPKLHTLGTEHSVELQERLFLNEKSWETHSYTLIDRKKKRGLAGCWVAEERQLDVELAVLILPKELAFKQTVSDCGNIVV